MNALRLLPLALLLVAAPAWAQQDAEITYFSQASLSETMERRSGSIDEVPVVYYSYHVVPQGMNRLQARLDVYERYGERDVVKPLVWLLNRNDLENLSPGDTLVVPNHFQLDFRAYSPFPRYYNGAADMEKIVVLDKGVQAWAAYEWGTLARWGIMNTGAQSSATPSGRFNVNWKQPSRISTLSPGILDPANSDEMWEMTWVMNIHEQRGIHLHQYALPTGGPASHGCVRMLEEDAHWLYEWTDSWVKEGGDEISSVGGRILRQGTMVLVIGSESNGQAHPFQYRERYPVLRMVSLPPDPYDMPAGSPQQEMMDRRMARGG